MKALSSVITVLLLFVISGAFAQTDYVPVDGTTTTINVPSSGYEFVYDHGGPGGDFSACGGAAGTTGDYLNCGCTTIMTICPDNPSGPVSLDFFEFDVFASFDWVIIYDNNAASGTELFNNDITGDRCMTTTLYEATNASGCLTIEFFATTGTNFGGFGAEIILPPSGDNDAGVASLITPQTGCPGDIEPVEVEVSNFGINRIDSVEVQWSLNGTFQGSVDVTDTIGVSESVNVVLGNVTFTAGQSIDIAAWTVEPNGVVDTVPANDTLDFFIGSPSLTGTYTAGDAGSDFAGLQEAIDTLAAYGVCGPVTINMKPGTYTGQFEVPEILGASATNTITVQSELLDSSTVVFSHPSSTSSADNHLLLMDGADYFTFQHLTFERMGGEDYATILELTNGADYNNFSNNEFRASRNYTTIEFGDYSSVFSSDASDDLYNTFTNNFFNGNGNGFWYYNTAGFTDNQPSLIVENNKIETFYVGLFTPNHANSKILNNIISRTSNTSTELYFGISLRDTDGDNVEVAYNQVYAKEGGYGIAIRDCEGTANNPILVYNNFAQAGGATGRALLADSDAKYVHFLHNNGLTSGTDAGAGAFYATDGGTEFLTLLNNNFANSNGGNAVYITTTASVNVIDSSDYNNVYTTGAELANLGGNGFPTLGDLQAGTGTDANSISVDPLYVSNNNLYAFNPALDGAGVEIPFITDDIFGELRTLPADIGANNVDAQANDVSLASINNSTICAGSEDISVTIVNTGTQDLTSALVVYSVDGAVQAPLSFGGTLASGEDSSFVVGSFNFTSSPQPYNIVAWVASPNGQPDPNTANDTASLSISTSLDGTYSIDPSGSGDYVSFNAAVDALNNFGICGPVTFNAVPGLYQESVQLNEVSGASATNTITFDGGDSTLVTLEYDGSGNSGSTYAVVYLNGADYVTFKNMTVRHSGTGTDEWGFMLSNAANYNTIEACKIEVELIGTTFDVAGIVASADEGDDFSQGDNANYNTIRGNLIIGGEKNIHLEGDDGGLNVGNKIINNRLFGADDHAIEVDDQDSLYVEGNIVRDLKDAGADAIYLFDVNNYTIIGNDVISPDWGIYVNDGNDGFTPAAPSLVANNMVISTSDYAVYLLDVESTDYFHNTTMGDPGLGLNDVETGIRVVNNIMASLTGFALDYADADPLDSLDYNIYYTPASNTNFVEVGTANFVDLADFQANLPGNYNTNSLEGDPLFVSATDLRVIGGLADSAATPIGITVDIDGNTRSTDFPDIGAYEFDVLNRDLSVTNIPLESICPGVSDVSVEILNLGFQDINSAQIFWTVNGAVQTPFTFNGVLPSFEDSTFVIGTFNFMGGNQTYDIQIWTDNPNGSTDQDPSNDTLLMSGVRTGLEGTYTIDTSGNGDFLNFNEAADALNQYGVCGPVVITAEPGVYQESVQLTEVTGASATNTITFDGGDSTLVTLEYDGSGNSGSTYAVVYLNGADYVTFKNMTVSHTGADTDEWGFMLSNAANYNTIEACKIEVELIGTTFDVAGIVSSANEGDDFSQGDNANYNTFRGNLIIGGEKNIHLEGDDGGLNIGNKIINNRLFGADDHAIEVDDQDSLYIEGNIVRNLQDAFADAIYLLDVNNYTIIGNDVISPDWGIYITDGNDGYTPPVPSLVANNMVISETDYAIYLNDVESTDFFHNTVLGDPGLGLNDVEIGVRVVNNIMASLTGYALDYSDADPLDSLDYNIYYTPVSNTNFVEVGTANFVDLADFQANLPGNYNTNSLEGNPIFISTSNDLHVLGPLADSSATPIGITVDVDGDTRNATFPDIGADEFDVRQIDIALLEILEQPQDDCDIAADSIVVRIAGFGIQPQSNVDVYYSVNGAAPVLGGTGTASVGIAEYDTVTLSGFDFTMDGIYDIEIFVSVANDEELSNDTINTTVENLAIPDLIVDNVSAICDSGTATIDVSTTAMMVNWYLENDTASAVYDTGRSVVTPFLTESDTLYAELIDEQSGFVGPLDNTIGTTNTSALTNQYMIFDVFQTLTLNSVLIIGDGTGGTITVTLEDNNSNVLQTASLNIVDGPNRYNLGFVIPPGTGYQLRVQNFGSASIYRNTTGANYPYELPGFLTITGNSFSPTYVYYFYDWEILVPGCNSDLIPVPVPVNPSPVVNLGADSEICQGDALVLDAGNAGADYEWSDGSDNQTLSVSTAGDYSVTVTDPSTCSDSDTVSVAVNPLPSVSIGNDTTLCDTAWVIFDAGAGFDAYRWTLNGDLVGNTQMITVEFPGTYTVEVETDQACTNTASATITVENCVGIEGLFAENAISIYPNPNDGQFNLSVDMEQTTKALFTLVDLSGKVIYEEELTLNQGNTIRNYDFDLLSAGVYLVKLTTEKDHHVQRLVID